MEYEEIERAMLIYRQVEAAVYEIDEKISHINVLLGKAEAVETRKSREVTKIYAMILSIENFILSKLDDLSNIMGHKLERIETENAFNRWHDHIENIIIRLNEIETK